MSYTFLQEQGEESSAECFSDISPCARLRLRGIAETCCSRDSETESFPGSPFGMMCGLLTACRGVALSTASVEASRVKTSQWLEKEPVSTASDRASGPSSNGSLAKFDPSMSSWKTRQRSLLGGLIEFSGICSRWGSMRSGELFRRLMPSGLEAHRQWYTSEIESGSTLSLPTMTVNGNNNRKGASATSGDGLTTVLKRCQRMPTPRQSDPSRGDCSSERSRRTPSLVSAVKAVPTPTATDGTKWNAKTKQQRIDQGSSLRLCNVETATGDPIGGSLNPTWVEWLMGWPLGWTELKPLETVKFRQWLHSHSGYSEIG